MNVVYSTDGLSGDKQRAWEAFVSEAYVSVDIKIASDPNFAGEITQSSFHDLALSRSRADAEFVRRTRRHIARNADDSCLFMFVRRGPVRICQFGRETTIESNFFSLLDLDSPYVHTHATATDTYFVKVPNAILRSRFRDIQNHCAISRPVGGGIGRIAADLTMSLSENIAEASGEAAACLASQFVDILGIVFEAEAADHPDGPSLARNAVRRRALDYIDRNLGDPELDIARIASGVGVSVRYLQRSFEDIDSSVTGFVRSRRLRLCREKLENPRFDLLRISDVARRHGFSNQSHFASSFKKEFGLSARDVRGRPGREPR
jgi:AraC-like DNA-binding protein